MANPFATTPLSNPVDYFGYATERAKLEKAMQGTGVAILRSLAGYGKTTLAKHYQATGQAHYIAPCTYEEALTNVNALTTQRFWFWERTRKIRKPILIDECGMLNTKTNGFIKAKLHDCGVKVVLILNHDEYKRLMPQRNELTLLDCVLEDVVLNGFSPTEVETLVKARTDKFEPAVIEALGRKYAKPRELLRICFELYERAGDGPVTVETLNQVEVATKGTVAVVSKSGQEAHSSSDMLYDFVLNHPGATFKQFGPPVGYGLNSEASVRTMLSRLVHSGKIRRTENGCYFIAGQGGSNGT